MTSLAAETLCEMTSLDEETLGVKNWHELTEVPATDLLDEMIEDAEFNKGASLSHNLALYGS